MSRAATELGVTPSIRILFIMIREHKEITIVDSTSTLTLARERRDIIATDRFIAIEGQKVLDIGNTCETCEYVFSRMQDVNLSIKSGEIAKSLNSGIKSLENKVIKNLNTIIPNGDYIVLLSEISPSIVYKDSENDYFAKQKFNFLNKLMFWKTESEPNVEADYYRLITKVLSREMEFYDLKEVEFYEFIIPTFPLKDLDSTRVELYQQQLHNGIKPTAISISVLDTKTNYRRRSSYPMHWIQSHYLIDGHHKVNAAARANRPITLLSYISEEHSIAPREKIQQVIEEVK